MHRQAFRSIARSSRRSTNFASARSFYASQPTEEPILNDPPTTQGHATRKIKHAVRKDMDNQSASVRSGMTEKEKAAAQPNGENEPFDAARQANAGGEAKGGGNATGPFKDQNGGQDEPHKGPGAVTGGSSPAAGYTLGETVANKVKGGFDSLKKMRTDERNFSTSARAYNGTIPGADPDGARKPVENDVQGDQNPHLKHTPGGSQGKAPKGNASPDPSLPSKQSTSNSTASKQTRPFSTSLRALADPNTPSGDAPIHGQKEAQRQSGLKQQPRGADVEHGGSAGAPSAGSKGMPQADSESGTGAGTSAPDPGLSKKEKGGAVKDGMGVRSFSTSTRALAAKPAAGYAKSTEPEAKKAGYDAPPTALPSGLGSAYQEKDPNAVQSADPSLKPSSEVPHSSTAVDPPNQALRQAALDGKLAERNPQPDVPGNPTGPQGIDEGWKHRK